MNGVPTTCFNDVVLVPIASWVFLLMLLGLAAFALVHSRRSNNGKAGAKAPLHRLVYRKGREYGAGKWPGSWTKTATTFSIIYSLLVLATLLMSECEAVHLEIAEERSADLSQRHS